MKTIAIAAAAAASLIATAASAQQATTPQNPGPQVPGVCVYHNARLFAQSAAGQAVETRMQQLAQEVQTELQPYATSLQTEAQQLQTSGSTLQPDELNRRRQQLQQRAQEAQQLEATRENELRYTLAMQRQAITQAVEPILVQVYQERGCGLLLDRESVFMMNPAHDVTDVVIQRLNTALPTLSFNRMAVPAQQPQQPAAAN
jgi:outer membrane protein